MKRERAYVDNRRNELLKVIEERPEVKVDELATIFDVSSVTIRRDLQYLEDNQKLVRFYGGDTVNKQHQKERDSVESYKELIARYAASLVEDGDTIFINTSSTAIMMLDYIKRKNVTAITNNGHAIYKEPREGLNVILTGGELRYPKEAMVGDFAIRNVQPVFAKKSFLGCSGISAESGMTTENANEVNINSLMVKNALKETYLLADHTKIGNDSSFISCAIGQIGNLITDELVPEEEIELIREKGVKVHIVKKGDRY
jgi:DeoR/GlpR family transcriptional regulator of sugar metabolism